MSSDDSSLEQHLKQIVGKDAVLSSPEDMMVFEFDGSMAKEMPQLVVLPQTTEQVSEVVRLSHQLEVPILPRGAGTGLSGGAVPVKGGIVLVLTRMNRIIDVDPVNRFAVVEPGVINIRLSEVVQKYGLHYPPDPSSQKACTIGGNIAENAGGPHCLAYGVTTNYVLGLEVVLPNGDITWLGGVEQDTPGYDLTGLFVGSEGTLGVATKIIVRLSPIPESIRTLVAVFNRFDDASETVSRIIAAGIIPAALEMMDKLTIEAVGPTIGEDYPPDADAILLVEVDGPPQTVAVQSSTIEAICKELGAREVKTAEEPQHREKLWAARKGALGALGRLAPNYYILDGVVPRTKLPQVLKLVRSICEQQNFRVANVFHAGDGNLHPNILFDERVEGQADQVLIAGEQIMKVCVDSGGTITGEHGVGLEKKDFMHLLFSKDDLAALLSIRTAFGADGSFNPCKILPTGTGCGEGWKLSKLPNVPGGFL